MLCILVIKLYDTIQLSMTLLLLDTFSPVCMFNVGPMPHAPPVLATICSPTASHAFYMSRQLHLHIAQSPRFPYPSTATLSKITSQPPSPFRPTSLSLSCFPSSHAVSYATSSLFPPSIRSDHSRDEHCTARFRCPVRRGTTDYCRREHHARHSIGHVCGRSGSSGGGSRGSDRAGYHHECRS